MDFLLISQIIKVMEHFMKINIFLNGGKQESKGDHMNS